ncbi:MAG: flagellar basal body rod protein FlgB [Desulfobacteraceae bacterium]|nr:MAG: flagellar basal body rod protein FlgB [Desulfobacteraceae bacterium]
MEIKTLFDGTIHLAEKALDWRARRHEVILSNIANADTPNYKAFDLMVEEALSGEVPKEGRVRLHRTDPDHIGAGGPSDRLPRSVTVELSPQATLRGDGNTVDMDREMSVLADNQLNYKAATQILARKFGRLRSIIQGGKG